MLTCSVCGAADDGVEGLGDVLEPGEGHAQARVDQLPKLDPAHQRSRLAAALAAKSRFWPPACAATDQLDEVEPARRSLVLLVESTTCQTPHMSTSA